MSRDYPTDKLLIAGLLKRDRAACDEFVLRYQKRVYAQVYQMVLHREDALDLTQEVFLKAFQGLPCFSQRSSVYTWLHRITINCCIDFLRSRGRKPTELGGLRLKWDVPASTSASPVYRVEQKELAQQIRMAVISLAPRQREVFMLRHWECLRISEIARHMKCSEGTVKAHLWYAHDRLRNRLRPYLEDGTPACLSVKVLMDMQMRHT